MPSAPPPPVFTVLGLDNCIGICYIYNLPFLRWSECVEHCNVSIYPDKKLCVCIALIDTVSAEELLECAIHAVRDNEHWRPGYDQIFDYRNLKNITGLDYMKSWSIAEKVNAIDKGLGRGRNAHICSTDMQYGMVRQWMCMRKNEGQAQVFRTVAEACDWLGIENPSEVGFLPDCGAD